MKKKAAKKTAGPIRVGRRQVLGGKMEKPGAAAEAAPGDEERRQEAFDFVPMWKGQALEAWSVSRETLFLQLRHANGAAPFYACARDRESFYPDAVRILFLCLHTPEDWRAYRGNLVAFQEELIDPWADEFLQSGADKLALVVLALKVWNASQENQAEPMPDERPGKGPGRGN